LPALQAAHPELPIIGVIEPGAEAAVAATKTGRIAVLATEGTVRGGAYQREILRRMPQARVAAIPATLFVALAEEGWTQGDVASATARRYLEPVLAQPAAAPDVLVLGCTHFPPLADVIQREAGSGIRIVDSAVTTAEALANLLATRGLAAPAGGQATRRFLVTDGEERFARVGPLFLGEPIAPGAVERVDL
jgi:glutamate racemase